MEYISLTNLGLKESKDMFLGIDDPSKLESYADRIYKSDVLFTDLDSCIAECLAEKLPIYDIGSKRILDPDFWKWGFRTALSLTRVVNGADIEEIKEESWNDYHENVLGKEGNLSRLEKFAAGKVQDLIYPGIEEFFELMHNTHNVIVTRNIKELTRPFARYLDFDFIETESFDKDDGLSRASSPYAHFQKYTFIGDYTTFLKSQRWLKRYRYKSIRIFVSEQKAIPYDIIDNVNIHIGRNYEPLASLIPKIKEEKN